MKAIVATFALLAAPLASPVALAQSDGTLGSSSTGTLNFNVNISDANRIRIRNVSNLSQTYQLGHIPADRGLGSTGLDANDSGRHPLLCVEMDRSGTYTLDWTATPLESATNTVPYRLSLHRDPRAVNFGRQLHAQQIAQASSGSIPNLTTGPTRCGAASGDGRLAVRIVHGRDSLMTVGRYVATITLTVTPE